MELVWARTKTCVEDCHRCGNVGRFFQYDSDAVVHRWLCLDCYEIEVSYCTCDIDNIRGRQNWDYPKEIEEERDKKC